MMEDTGVSVLIDDVKGFFRAVPPFQFLDEKTLAKVARGAYQEYYPKGATVLKEGGPASGYLNVIKKGGVKVFIRSDDGREVVMDYRGEGESFGFISLITGDRSRANVVTVEDTICYQIDRATVLALMDEAPSFSEYYVKSFLIKSIDKTYKDMHKRTLLYGGGEKLLFTTPVGKIISKAVVTGNISMSIRDAARLMAENNISSLVLLDEEGGPAGIITDRDLRAKVVARGRDVDGPAGDVMSATLVRADASEYCFEALLKMIRYGIHHLLVVKDGRLAGVVTNHDFMLLQGNSPVTLVRDIESRQTIEELSAVSAKTSGIVSLLLKEDARAGSITRIITEINDRLVRQAIEITMRKHGTPPVPFCWIAYGSEGRKEQTFKTDQDNGIIYADPATPAQAEAAKEYFAAFSADMSEALARCGFPPCPAGYMASNPKWRKPLKEWKETFMRWIYNPTPDAVLSSLIFFDFRAVHGVTRLADELRDSLASMLADQEVFLGFMAGAIVKNRPPVGFFKTFVVEKSGEHKDMLNLKIKGVAPLVDAVRLFALEKGLRETSTLERINALKGVHTIAADYSEEMAHAFEFITLLRVHHQFMQIESGVKPDNFINPNTLSGLERRTLKEAFDLTSEIQGTIIERYKRNIW